MKPQQHSVARISGIDIPEKRVVSVDGPPMKSIPRWGLFTETAEVEYHLCPAITYELHYQIPRYNILHMFNGSEGRYAIGNTPLVSVKTEANRTGLVPPDLAVRIIQDKPLEYLAIRVRPERFDRIAGDNANGWQNFRSIFRTVDPALTALCTEVRRVMICETLSSGQYLDTLADAIVARLATNFLADSQTLSIGSELLSPFIAKRIAKKIDENIGEPIHVSALAEQENLSRAHFSRAFSNTFGMPARRYILSRRIAHARNLLTDTSLSATEISKRCGFSNPSHLTHAFKQELGLTPSEYRKALQA
ncbi:MAG: AraC family transcriptional regulator [Pseudomonadota bacterium]